MSLFNRKIGKRIDSAAIRGVAADSLNDVAATSAVLLSSIISHFIGFDLDGYMGLVVAVLIFIAGINVAKETIDPLIGMRPSHCLLYTSRCV